METASNRHLFSRKWLRKDYWVARPREDSMTTDNPATSEDKSKHLTEMILKGDHENAATLAAEIAHKGLETNDSVAAIYDAINIVVDHQEVERYSIEQVEKCEQAEDGASQAKRRKIRVEQSRISG